jgi:hypothetical protein
VEQRIYPRIEHPIPVLQSRHVRLYDKLPDLKTLAVDALHLDEGQVEVKPDKPLALVTTDEGKVFLLTLTKVHVPQDKTDQWQVAGTIKPVAGIVEHIPDPLADRGRAVLVKEPLKLAGKLVFGLRDQMMTPTTFYSIDLADPDAKPKEVATRVVEGRVAGNGTVVDRVESRKLRITAAGGKVLGEVALDSDIAEFNVSPDGRSVVLSTERYVDVPDAIGYREIATIVYSATGEKQWEVVGYDDAAFLPDGNLLLTGKGGEEGLFVVDARTRKATRLEIKDAPTQTRDGRAPDWWPRTPAVSPDGKRVAFVSGQEVYAVGIDGRGWTPVWLTDTREPQTVPVFSPDGRYVAMVVTPLNVMTGPGEMVVFDTHKRVRQPVRGVKARSDVPLTWHP